MIEHTHASRPRRRRGLSVLAATGLAAGAVLLVPPSPASAHVRVQADATTTGSFSALTFRVPNESDTARTTKISIELPQTTPFLYVSTKPVPGWRSTSTTEKLPAPVDADGTTITKAVRTIVWTAESEADAVGPGEYQEFSASVGPLPAPGTIMLPATQTYSDGSVVKWDEATQSGSEPEHPAPEVVVTAAQTSADPSATGAPSAGTADTAGTSETAGTTDPTARVLGGAGLLVGLAGLVVGVLGLRARRGTSA